VPGPSAGIAALSAAGLPTDRYCFEGFLPAKRKSRQDRLEALQTESRSMIFFASVHRIRDTLADLAQAFGSEREAFLARELTKVHEQCVAGTLGVLLQQVDAGTVPAKGEFAIVVGGSNQIAPDARAVIVDRLLRELLAVLPAKQAVAIVARVCGQSRNAVYREMLAITGQRQAKDAS
jgi:16S rRNA (cytidine1402-2'-O)-methyltransferase